MKVVCLNNEDKGLKQLGETKGTNGDPQHVWYRNM